MTVARPPAALRQLFNAHGEAERRRMPLDEVLGEREQRRHQARWQRQLEREEEAESQGMSEDHWSVDPWNRGAYSYWRIGQYKTISGYEGVQEGNVHFAGEHTDPENQGFLNGAVVSGERAAREIARQA